MTLEPGSGEEPPDRSAGHRRRQLADVDRLLRARRWETVLPVLGELIETASGSGELTALRRRRRMAAALSGQFALALPDAEWIVRQAPTDAEDLRHLAHIRLSNLLVEEAFDAAAAALALQPALQRAQAVACVAAVLQPSLTARAAALFGPPPPQAPAVREDPESKRISVALAWRLPIYAPYGGAHPVIVSALGRGSVLQARWTDAATAPHPAYALPLLPRLAAWAARLPDRAARQALAELLTHRLPLAFYPSAAAAFAFHHTVPFGIDGRPWLFHLEQLNMLHAPVVTFPHAVIRLDAPWLPLLRDMFAAPECLGVVTHIRRTAASMRRLFPEPEIQAKLAHIPLGIDAPPPPSPAIRRATRILLFTNSFGPDNFFIRGGVDVLQAAIRLSRRRDDVRVVIRSGRPDTAAAAVSRWRRLRNVEWITERLSEQDIHELYRRSDIFLLPSGVLHAVSLARALRTGLGVVATDVFGVDEFIRHGVNGLIVPGRRSLVERPVEGALFAEDCRPLFDPSPSPIDGRFHRRFVATVERLLDDPALLRRLRRNAARQAARDHDDSRWARDLSHWAAERFALWRASRHVARPQR